jgi:DNA-binding transcriptional MerR regulator
MSLGLTLDEIQEMQPEPGGPRRKRGASWLRQNWLALAGLVIWALGQLQTGDRWVQTRTHTDDELAQQVLQLRTELTSATATYVRQDVFGAELRAINTRLESIDRKLDNRR